VHAAESLALAMPRGIASISTYAGSTRGILALGLGHPEDAVHELEPVRELALAHGLEHPNVVPWQPDLVEAYVRCDRHATAERELEVLERRARQTGGTWSAAAALRCRGLLAGSVGFAECFERALALHATQPMAFERARTELCYGERLRRAGRRAEAREPLRRALSAFERMGARPWAELARAELAAAGEHGAERVTRSEAELTAQELQVARVVAAGASNAEAAAQLFVSPKTVEKHLTSAYRKLGVRSRAQLAARFALTQFKYEPVGQE
jgi:DNA-binding NarL/FixJ family response regulator